MDALVIGAGVSGLTCAGSLARAGLRVAVLERARGVGGRCATRRFDGQPVDFGLPFVHGREPGFLDSVREVGADELIEGWPTRVVGRGTPCQPRALDPGVTRLAIASGLSAFPKHLAHDLDIRLESEVVGLDGLPGKIAVRLAAGSVMQAPAVVLAVHPPRAEALLASIRETGPDLAVARRLASGAATSMCLTVIAGLAGPGPDWEARLPGSSPILEAAFHDSTKRRAPRQAVLVLHARPCWSRANEPRGPEAWSRDILCEAERVCGRAAAGPSWSVPHRWRHARLAGHGLTAPPALRLDGGGLVVVAGEAGAPGAGLEGAWLAGLAAARRVTKESRS